ncbi:uncharacterized protein LOC129943371 [Eupeodes corollae]|uniref:uncharacterized protein LOC129943371 n=1 Tax=Eupeodes corollae TaxID=290404 RepID=UPI002491C3FA|nr:uncharacterized protein LOC129943371 [Eupeodes corollae]
MEAVKTEEAVEGVQATADVLGLSQSTSKRMQIASTRQSSGWRGGSTSLSSARSARYADAIAAIVQSTNSRPERKTKYESFGTSVASQQKLWLNYNKFCQGMSLQRRSIASHSSLSSSVEGSDLLQSAMINSDLFDQF